MFNVMNRSESILPLSTEHREQPRSSHASEDLHHALPLLTEALRTLWYILLHKGSHVTDKLDKRLITFTICPDFIQQQNITAQRPECVCGERKHLVTTLCERNPILSYLYNHKSITLHNDLLENTSLRGVLLHWLMKHKS